VSALEIFAAVLLVLGSAVVLRVALGLDPLTEEEAAPDLTPAPLEQAEVAPPLRRAA
jgi:hypothetical protein